MLPFPGKTGSAEPAVDWPPVDKVFADLVKVIAAKHFTPGPVAAVQLELRPDALPDGVPAAKIVMQLMKPLTSVEVSTALDRVIAGIGAEQVSRRNVQDDLVALAVSSSKPVAELTAHVEQLVQTSGLRALEVASTIPRRIFVSVAPMNAQYVVPVEIDLARVADFLDAVGKETVHRGYNDVQVWLQNRRSKGTGGLLQVNGVLIDGDVKVPDPGAMIVEAGIPIPNIVWETLNGFKLGYIFDGAVEPETAELIAKRIALAVPGGDPGSWDLAQGQHAPTAIKSRGDDQIPVPFSPMLLNPVPYPVTAFSLESLPPNLRQVWGSAGSCTREERTRIEAYLVGLGIPAPEENGKDHLYSRCPRCEQHDTSKTYVDRTEDGGITVRCLGHHDGDGRLSWNESDLLVLAGGAPSTAPNIDAVKDVPATWAGAKYLESTLAEAWEDDKYAQGKIPAAINIWQYAKAHAEVRGIAARARGLAESKGEPPETVAPPSVAEVLAVYRVRASSYLDMPSARVFYDEAGEELRIIDGAVASRALRVRSESLNPKAHANIWRACNCFNLVPELTSDDEDEKDNYEDENGETPNV